MYQKIKIMFKYLSILLLLFTVLPTQARAQQSDDEDPFKRDPFFTKPIHEFFSSGNDSDGESAGYQNPDNRPEHYMRQIRNLNEEGIDLSSSFEAGPYSSGPLYSQFPNMPMIHFNRVNGLFLGIRQERMQWHQQNNFLNITSITPHGFIGFGTASGDWEYAVGLEKLFGSNKYLMLGGEYHRASATDDYWRMGLIETSVSAFLTSFDYPDYYLMEGFGLYANIRTHRLWEASASFNVDTFSSLEQNTQFSLFGGGRHYRPVMPVDTETDVADIKRVNFGLSFNPHKVILSPNFTFSATATAELAGRRSYNNDFNYDKFLANVIFYYNPEPGTLLKWRVSSGSVTGVAPLFKQFHLGGPGSLRATPFKSWSGNRMIMNNFEVQFGGLSHRNDWIDFDDFYISLFIDSGWVQNHVNPSINLNNPFNGFGSFDLRDMRHDGGVGIGSGLLRGELAWPLDGSSSGPQFWLRLNPSF